MATPTKQEMLENVENAINTFINNGAVQSYSIGGRSVHRSELPGLIKWRDQLRREIAGSGGATTYASFGRPS